MICQAFEEAKKRLQVADEDRKKLVSDNVILFIRVAMIVGTDTRAEEKVKERLSEEET